MPSSQNTKSQQRNAKQERGAFSRWLLPFIIVTAAVFCSILMTILSPPPKFKEEPQKAMLVSALQVHKEDMTITIPSQGRVSPHTRTILISEVSGLVTKVTREFVSGGFVNKGQLLVKLDDRNYRAAVKQAEANVARASKDLIQEKGQAQVAQQQYLRSKNTKRTPEALSLLLREPQLKESEANLAFALAELERIKGDLANTEIRAPYDGLIKKKHIDIGQYASIGTSVAEIIAVDYAEVRLAIPQDRLAYLDLPLITASQASSESASLDGNETILTNSSEDSTNTSDITNEEKYAAAAEVASASASTSERTLQKLKQQDINFLPVNLKSVYGDVEYQWPAKIVRTEGFFDETSHTLYAVARIEDPYMLKLNSRVNLTPQVPLLMGTYVEAEIQGHHLQNMVKIPRHLLRAGNNVWVIDDNNQLRNRKLEILRTGGDEIYVTSGLEQGERVCMTNVGEVVPGTSVRIAQEKTLEPAETAMLYD